MYTAEEYRNLMIGVMNMAIREAEQDYEKERVYRDEFASQFNLGYVQGLKEAKRKLEVSKFLSNPEFKD